MNMYELIRQRYIDGEIPSNEVMRFALEGILSFTEATQIITLKRKEDMNQRGCNIDDEE